MMFSCQGTEIRLSNNVCDENMFVEYRKFISSRPWCAPWADTIPLSGHPGPL